MTSPVKTIRSRLFMTQSDLAVKLGVCRQMIWAYETGRSMPRMDIAKKLMAIAREYHIEVKAEDFFVE